MTKPETTAQIIELFPRATKSARPDEVLSSAAQLHMAVRLREFAEAAVEHLERFKRPLNGPLNVRLMNAIDAIEGPK